MSNIDPSFYEEDDDEWEDEKTYRDILATVPDGWKLIRVMSGWSRLVEMREWLADSTIGQYKEVNWDDGGCSYSVGVMLEEPTDIVIFKLRWG